MSFLPSPTTPPRRPGWRLSIIVPLGVHRVPPNRPIVPTIDFFAFGQQPIAVLMNFSCRLQGKDKMVRKVIDFEAAKDRRAHQEDADQAQGELRARLITVMVLSGLSD